MEPIKRKFAKGDKRLRVLVLTCNQLKKREYKALLGNTYGINLSYAEAPETINEVLIRQLVAEADPSPHYVLREESGLVDACKKTRVDALAIVNDPESAPSLVLNVASLSLWKPVWNKDKTLSAFEKYTYEHTVRGYIDPQYASLRDPEVFGWDHLFVNPNTGYTCLQSSKMRWGKTSARQQVLADFVTNHLFYKSPLNLKHHPELAPGRSVEFSEDMSVARFMQEEPHLSNPNLSLWALDKIKARVLGEGVFFKAGTSRPVKSYFSPPFGGIPLTTKKTAVEETVFMMHDLNHHNVPDLIFDGDTSTEARNVYVAWRMMSEAMTLVIADMFYANTVVLTNPEDESAVDRRIYPLFKALSVPPPSPETRKETVRQCLWANTLYAVLGDDSGWRALLKEGQEDKLEAYKNHFEKFFVGDHVWTAKNFENIAANAECSAEWVRWVGRDTFSRAGLIFVGEVKDKLTKRGADLSTLESAVPAVFGEIMETRIHRFMDDEEPVVLGQEEMLSRAFRRYMIGLMSFYTVYKELPGMEQRAVKLAERIRSTDFFHAETMHSMRREYERDVRHAWGMGIITSSACANFMEVHPVFPPVYISYGRQECKTVKDVVKKLYSS